MRMSTSNNPTQNIPVNFIPLGNEGIGYVEVGLLETIDEDVLLSRVTQAMHRWISGAQSYYTSPVVVRPIGDVTVDISKPRYFKQGPPEGPDSGSRTESAIPHHVRVTVDLSASKDRRHIEILCDLAHALALELAELKPYRCRAICGGCAFSLDLSARSDAPT